MDSDTESSSFFGETDSALWTQVTHMGMIISGVLRADGGLPPWGSLKERAMSSLCPEVIYLTKKDEADLMRFSDLDLTLYAST